jgi:hypothetical protein
MPSPPASEIRTGNIKLPISVNNTKNDFILHYRIIMR